MKAVIRASVLMVVLAAVVGIPGDRVQGYSWYEYGGVNVVWAGGQSVRYLSPASFPPGSDAETLLLAAMGLWNMVPEADFEYFYDPNGLDTIDPFDGYNDTIAAELDPGVLAVTYLVNDGAQWYDMDQVYSPYPAGIGWTLEPLPDCETITAPEIYGYSLLLDATHELGHALGLGHDPFGNEPPGTPFLAQTMNPSYPCGGPVGQQNIIELHTADRNGTRFLYPHSGPSYDPFVDLANASYSFSDTQVGKVVPVFFDPPAVYPQDELTVRCLIENFGTTNEFFIRQGYYLSDDATIDTGDMLLATMSWDLAFQDAIDFDAIIDMPADLPAGEYHVGTILDDLDEIAEVFEDNNAVVYCQTLTVSQLAPVINPMGQEVAVCGVPFVGSAPTLTHPLNMNPITWSLDNPEPGMTVNPDTGIISWPAPLPSEFLYTIHLRATNSGGSTTQTVFLGVNLSAPTIVPLADESITCQTTEAYVGPTPATTEPTCMEPIINWWLDTAPPGMTIENATGVVTWPDPLPSETSYTITIGATNAGGNDLETWYLSITGGADINGDTLVDIADLQLFVSVLLSPETADPASAAACDLNGDGTPDGADLQPFVDCFIAEL